MIRLALVLYAYMGVVAPPGQPTDFIDYLSNASGPALMAVIIFGAVKEWWVPGGVHRRLVAQRDQLLELALKSQEVGTRALDAAGVAATKIPEGG